MKTRLAMPYMGDVVLELEDAVKIIEILSRGEKYEYKYAANGGSTHHVYPMSDFAPTITVFQDEVYRVAKLAGKPEK